MEQLLKLTGPALARLAAYLVPLALGALFAWLASLGWGVWNAEAGTWTITLSVAQITGLVVAFLGAPALAITALLKGAKSRVGDIPVAERVGDKPISGPTIDTKVVAVKS